MKRGSENSKFSGLFLSKTKKGALSVDIPIELIALVFSFVVIVTLFIPPIYHWLQQKSSSGVCEWSIVAGAIARPLGKEVISPACKANKINISIKDLQPHLG
ncbi:hypothetical protein HY837_05760 [archaeon]|nr:hypothetical protein [archaeon]